MANQIKRGASIGALFALLIILSQPFQPATGLIPELAKFFTTVPLWIAAMIFHTSLTPLAEGVTLIVYFLLLGVLIGAAFGAKPIWGWLLVIVLSLHHYIVNDRVSLKMGEVVQQVLNYFG